MEKMNFVGDVFTDSGKVIPVLPVVKTRHRRFFDQSTTLWSFETLTTMRTFKAGDEVLVLELGEYTKATVPNDSLREDSLWSVIEVLVKE